MEALMRANEIEVRYKRNHPERPRVHSSTDAYKLFSLFFNTDLIAIQEMTCVMYLNASREVLGVYKLSRGGINKTVVDVRLILAVAVKVAAVEILVAHNHPSGDILPSESDKHITAWIKTACAYLDIRLSDHLIITSRKGLFFSFADQGLL